MARLTTRPHCARKRKHIYIFLSIFEHYITCLLQVIGEACSFEPTIIKRLDRNLCENQISSTITNKTYSTAVFKTMKDIY